ncbi:MAG: bifunctional adenosylcobinamide kinase/adenosylcobinamide-phosphate guanylyltransferase [Acidobacteria bacterium]|nr:bifunctional adenosylcobinamide kinase/adenosylcobinamide-phosphate guanylyltransferase [Acidobacteriota bacterium]
MKKELIFILGGARSGKSTHAERLARRGRRVLFVATAEARDEDMKRRIAAHRERRPADWDTLEEPLDLVAALRPLLDRYDTFLLDCLTLWASNLLLDEPVQAEEGNRIPDFARELMDLIAESPATWILVSNEVGQGIVPSSALGRAYRDALGRMNQMVASRANRVYLMTAGLALELKSLGARPYDKTDPDPPGP